MRSLQKLVRSLDKLEDVYPAAEGAGMSSCRVVPRIEMLNKLPFPDCSHHDNPLLLEKGRTALPNGNDL